MNEEISVISSMDRCPDCGGRLILETARPKGGGNIISEVYVCRNCPGSFTRSALLHSKVEALTGWLSERMGGDVDTGHEFKTETHWFRLSSARPAPTLSVSQEALEDHPVEKIQSDLDRLQVPEMLVADPEQELLYTTSGEVKKYDP